MGDERVELYGTINDLFFTPKEPVLIACLARSKWVIRPLIDHLDNSTWVISTGYLWGEKRRSPEKRALFIFKIRACITRTDLKNKAFSADFWLFIRSDFAAQDRILKIRVLTSLGHLLFRDLSRLVAHRLIAH